MQLLRRQGHPGDCGDEYRKPPFLTASGDLSHHLDAIPSVYKAEAVPGRPGRWRVSSGSIWEPIAGYSRSVRVGNRVVFVSAQRDPWYEQMRGAGRCGGTSDLYSRQDRRILEPSGAKMDDVVRTRVYLRDASKWEPVSRAHGRVFGEVLPPIR